MGLHPRVGVDSPIQLLTSDLLERFFSMIPICIPDDYPHLLDAIDKHPKRSSLNILFRGKTESHSGEHPVGARMGGKKTHIKELEKPVYALYDVRNFIIWWSFDNITI